MSEYLATIKWRRDDQPFTDHRYSRGHFWEFDGGITVPASASPHVVPLPMSIESNVDPEEAFVAAISNCHMLFFLSMAVKNAYVIDSYTDKAIGTMEKDANGKMSMTKVVLHLEVVFQSKQPSLVELEGMHYLVAKWPVQSYWWESTLLILALYPEKSFMTL